MSEAIT